MAYDDDLLYRPLTDGFDWFESLPPAKILVLNVANKPVPEEILEAAPAVRSAAVGIWSKILHEGTYAMLRDAEWWVVVVFGGLPAIAARSENLRFSDQDDMAYIRKVFDAEWSSAHALAAPEFGEGDYVRVIGEAAIGTVKRVTPMASFVEVDVVVEGVLQQYGADSLEKVAGDPTEPQFWLVQPPSTVDDFAFALTMTKMTNALSDVLYSYSSSKTIFRPYQFIPAIKVLKSSSGRLLIADEVGLGKTIEAGLIWSELEQRAPIRRVLLVTPASLREKWRAEMARRFDRDVDLLRIADIEQFTKDLRDGRDPDLCGVISIESLRRPQDLLEQLANESPRFDLVIVDEAHSLRNRDTSSFRLGQYLSDWADNLIFLSATPINLGNDDLFNLVNLLEGDHYPNATVFGYQLEPNEHLNAVARRLPEARRAAPGGLLTQLRKVETLTYGSSITRRPDYAELIALLSQDHSLQPAEIALAKRLIGELNTLSAIFTRTTKRDVPDAQAIREPVRLDVEWTARERAFYESVERLFREKARHSGAPPGFIMQMPLRQAASCIPAMRQYLRERSHAGDFDDLEQGWFGDAVDDSVDVLSETADDEKKAWERSDLATLEQEVERVGEVDTKFDALLTYLRMLRSKGMPQVMLFSFFRRTLAYLARRLSDEFRLRVMTGKTPGDERETIMRDFRAGKFDLLLLSEVGSEGLDFEFCNVLVNYDLPWNPMRIEQRIGRLDRFGQQHEKIFVINMHVPGTIETDIFERLYSRIGIFERSIGELEPILQGKEFRSLSKILLDPNLSPQQRLDKADQMAESLARKEQDVAQLQESRGLLSYADRLEIDGITDAGPTDGRYIGHSEIRRILERFLERVGGSLKPSRAVGTFVLQTTEQLRSEFAEFAYRQSRRGEFQRIQRLMTSDDVIELTFASDIASKTGIELLSSRHPLIRCASSKFAGSPMLHRFASVTVPGLALGQQILVRIDVSQSTGLAPRRELWITGLDVETGDENTEIERLLLTSLAEGTMGQGSTNSAPMPRVREVDALRAKRRYREERRRRADNESLISARIQAREQTIQGKISSENMALRSLYERSRGEQVIRMRQARIAHLERQLADVGTSMAERRHLSLSSKPVAYALVTAQP